LLDPAFREGIVSTSATQYGSSAQEFGRQRATPRVLPKSLIYVACGAANGGMVLNVSDAGMAVSMAIAVGDETYANVSVRMNGLPQSVEVRGRMAWNLPGRKRAGIELLDVSTAQREKIREWIALDGVRDVNLLPRVEEFSAGASRVGEGFGESSRDKGLPILDKNSEAFGAAEQNTKPIATTPLTVAALPLPELREAETRTVAVVPAARDLPKAANVMAASAFVPAAQPTLLDMFGGTPPESLGPLPERFADGERTLRSEASLGIGGVDSTAFRENEWDLASVTMVPRKKSRPAWSTVGFVLLWVAIPCFGLGALIGRRPLEHWLASHGTEKNVSANQESAVVAANESSNVAALPKAAVVEPTQIPDSETLQPPATAGAGDTTTVATNAERLDRDGWRDLSGSAVYGGSGDSKLLNSLSTQEARALKNVPRGSSAATESAASTNTPKEIFRDLSAGNISSVATKINPVVAPAEVARNSGSASQGTIAAQNFRADTTKDTAVKAPATPATVDTARPVAGNSVASAASSNVPRGNVQAPASVDAASVAVSHSYDAGASSIAAKPVASTVSNATGTAANSLASSPSTSTTAASGSGSSGVAVAPKSGANNVAVSVASAPASASVAVNPVNVNAVASAAPVVATPSTQHPLRGTVLVARKSDEAFLLKLPAESISSDESVATRMQRTVMVPAQSRWHGHGPIAKVAVGELLSDVKLDGTDGGVKARAGESVTVRAYVDRNGDIEQLKAVSGRAALAPRVMRAVREWQFDQTRVDGKAVDSEVDITVEFRR
jgi:TonB-like protein/PilZ domain-containing protein